MSTEDRAPPSDMSETASRTTLALNPLVGIRGEDLIESAGILFKAMVNEPKVATEQWLSFLGEVGSIFAGKSDRMPKSGDRRFSDATWKESALHGGMLKAYLAWGDAVSGFVDKTSLSDIDKTRAHLVTEILIDAVAPTNAMMTNPIQNAEKLPATKPDRIFNEAPPCFEQFVTSRTCRECVLTKTLVNSGISAPAMVPQLMMMDKIHQRSGWAMPSLPLKSPSNNLLATNVTPMETADVSQTR